MNISIYSVCGWPWSNNINLLNHYNELFNDFNIILNNNNESSCYIYSPNELHTTIITLSSFKHNYSYFALCDDNEKSILLQLYKDGK
jgi:hypothetical protein